MNAPQVAELDPPPPPKDIHESLAAYLELVDLGEAFVRAGLRQRLRPGEDVETVFRKWNREQIIRAADEKIRCMEASANSEADDAR
jgi:hypothetical protein